MPTSFQIEAHRSVAELTGRLEAQIQVKIDQIASGLPRASRSDDALKFLAKVRSATASTIRQAPAAAQRALSYIQNENSSLAEIARVIEEDTALTQALLRTANSAFYATGGAAVVSLTQAAQRIGASGVHNVVIGNMVNNVICRPGVAYQPMVDQVRTHMLRTAALARVLARSFHVPADEAYSLGLLHDVGKLIIFDTFGTLRHQLRRDLLLPQRLVLDVLNALHEAFGGLAVLRWNLGAQVAGTIATHHRMPIPTDRNRVSELLFIAERADHARHGVRPLDVEAWWKEGGLPDSHTVAENLITKYQSDDELV